ncbi:AAAP family transporter: amino acid [Chlorella sorokiniana]|uniref:AAAP family transporter: amino acid n=1 Tax=Chlorella sorokiniana TaxID=3076 RepID=A0A2P6TPQ1_CHLSO|nr:AAAP family transporter: amino acid [Chlorella sorokiniana]|eukprot:PRW56012.1 AAAP family transporter: amino acid [Chlorella sorokiniana]
MAEPGTARSSVITLINSSVGAGVLSFPYAFRAFGWAAGLAAVVLIGSVESFTLYVLSRYAEYTKAGTYSGLVRKMLGPQLALLMCAVMIAYPFGSCVAYLIITGDSFQPLLLELFGAAWYTSRTAIITAIGCGAMLPLCFRTRLGALKAVSSMCVWGLLVVVGIIVFRSAQIVRSPDYSSEAVKAVNTSSGLHFLSALVIVLFGFQCHTNVVPVFEELDPQPAFFPPSPSPSTLGGLADTAAAALSSDAAPDYSAAASEEGANGTANGMAAGNGAAAAAAAGELHYTPLPLSSGASQRSLKSEKLEGMRRVVVLAVAVTGVLYSCVGLAGYLAFPTSARSDIMLSFGEDDLLIQIARATVGLIQIAAYVINAFPARGAIRDLILQTTGRTVGGPGFVAVQTLAFFFSTLALALLVTDLGNIFKVVGGTCGNVLILFMPGCLLVQYARSKHVESRKRRQLLAEAAQLEAPLLNGGAGGAAGASGEAAEPALPPLYSLWWSKLFWSGVVLLLLSAGLAVLTVYTTLYPLPEA